TSICAGDFSQGAPLLPHRPIGWIRRPIREPGTGSFPGRSGSAIVIVMVTTVNEAVIENAALEWFRELGYRTLHGLEIAPGSETAERGSYEQVVLLGRLRDAVVRLNPDVPPAAHDEALRQALRRESADLVAENRRFHRALVDGITVPYQEPGG